MFGRSIRVLVGIAWRRWRRLVVRGMAVGAVGGLLLIACLLFAKREVDAASEGRVFRRAGDIPARKVALVLGCARKLSDGRDNLYFSHRMVAARELFASGKVGYFLVSGDNSRKTYDESTDMRDALVELGIPEDRIVRDYAGFSTLDSVVRAKKVFCEDSLIVVSQDFHVRRAIYIGESHGIDLVGFAATDVTRFGGVRTKLREYLARLKAMLDVRVLHRGPKFLGDTIPIGANAGRPGTGSCA